MEIENVHINPNRRSNRVERQKSAVSRPYFHPLCTFELEIQSERGRPRYSYSKMAIKYKFHLVPPPIDRFNRCTHRSKFRSIASLNIKLNLSCLLQQESGEKVLFENLIDDKYRSINLKVNEKIVKLN